MKQTKPRVKYRCDKCGRLKKESGEHVCPTSSWNKGIKGIMKSWNKGKPAPWEKNLPQHFKKGDKVRLGIPMSEDARKKSSESHKGKTGDKAGNWKGGISYDWKVKNAPRPRPIICEACGRNGKICFDHDHKTDKFRGWICMQCNFVLGLMNDDREMLMNLIKYLAKTYDE